MKPKRLGRGLSGLLQRSESPPATNRGAPPPASPDGGAAEPEAVRRLALGEIRPNPYQPRKTFRPEELEELKASIQEHGVLQAVVVRPGPVGFELIAGERRLMAVKALVSKDTRGNSSRCWRSRE